MTERASQDTSPSSFFGQVRRLPRSFWLACVMYALERVAFYAVRLIVPLYLYDAGLSQSDKAVLFGIWGVVVFATPLWSSLWADQRGYRRAIITGSALSVVGYAILAAFQPAAAGVPEGVRATLGFWLFAAGVVLAGAGTGVLQPACDGTIAKVVPARPMTLSWGILYFLANLAAAGGPILGGALMPELGLAGVAGLCVVLVAITGVLAWRALREPIEVPSKNPGLIKAGIRTVVELVTDSRFAIPMACFAVVFTMASYAGTTAYVADWIEPAGITHWLGALFGLPSSGRDAAGLEMLTMLNGPVLLLAVPVAYWVGKTHRLKGVILGSILAIASLALMAFSTEATLAGAIVVSTIAQLLWYPAMEAYVAVLAPGSRKASYMAYFHLLTGGAGWALGAAIGWISSLIDPGKIALARDQLGGAKGVPDEQVMSRLAESLHTTEESVGRRLYNQHDPWMVWLVYALVATAGLAGLLWYYRSRHRQRPVS